MLLLLCNELIYRTEMSSYRKKELHYPGHPLAQRPHILVRLVLQDLKEQVFETLRPHAGDTLDVEG